MHKPYQVHHQPLKRVFRYLKGTTEFSLPIRPSTFQLQAFANSDWAANPNDRRSISGFCEFLGDNLLSWSVKKQPTVARSSTEAEYRALASTASDIMWLRRLLLDFQIPCPTPTPLYCDNVSALALANNSVFMPEQNTLRWTTILFGITSRMGISPFITSRL
ncbi:uncharacterized protein LOC110115757 [Dendrobium catenatum]|uniref:uncharacterized protein LOC110115757 n=1 Tax=Dendrobium catenatum TaxID=906689 RepID=UPI0009F6E21E|nr:uncharacterized protein LOC110115757 [Dendrobium catenatum]